MKENKGNLNQSINKERRKLLGLAGAAGTAALLSPLLARAQPSTIIEAGSNVDTASYIIFKDGNTIYAKNGTTGKIEFQNADAATVIQGALNNLTAGRTWKEKVVIKGDFIIEKAISPQSYTIIDIQGRLKLKDNITTNLRLFDLYNVNNIEIKNGILDGNKSNQNKLQISILIGGCNNVTVQNVKSINWTLYTFYSYDSSDINFLYNRIEDCNECGIAIEGTIGGLRNNVMGNIIKRTGLVGANNKNSVHYENAGSHPQDSIIANNIIIESHGGGIVVMGACYKLSIVGNIIRDCQGGGMGLIACNDILVSNNILDNNGLGGPAGYHNGIRIDDNGVTPGSSDITIVSNRIKNHTGAGVITRGISDYITIVGNNVKGNGVGIASDPINHPNNIIKNNVGYITEKSGMSLVLDSGTIPHNLSSTPTKARLTGTIAGEIVTVTSLDATNIKVAIKKPDGSSGTPQTVYWEAEV